MVKIFNAKGVCPTRRQICDSKAKVVLHGESSTKKAKVANRAKEVFYIIIANI